MRLPLLVLAGPILALVLAVPAASETAVPGGQAEITLSFAPVVRQATPAVVNIYATVLVADRSSPFADDPFFDQFFQDFGPATPRVQNSLGSGVIVAPDGMVVSNYHVVAQATEIRVRAERPPRIRRPCDAGRSGQRSGRAATGRGATTCPRWRCDNSDELRGGRSGAGHRQPVRRGADGVLGHRLGSGAVGAAGGRWARLFHPDRCRRSTPATRAGRWWICAGRLVGINTAILTQGGGSNGIGFAIPANLVRSRCRRRPRRGPDRFQPALGRGFGADGGCRHWPRRWGWTRPEGVLLSDLHPQSPFAAGRAGKRAMWC